MSDTRLYLMTFGVDEKYRGKGVGCSMMAIILKEYKHYHQIILDTAISNDRAISLYKRLGFIKVEVKPNYYSNSIHAVRMAKFNYPVNCFTSLLLKAKYMMQNMISIPSNKIEA